MRAAPRAPPHNFRPIVTFRATFLAPPPVARARKSEQRINQLTPAQMVQEISLTPFSFDGGRGITLTNNDNILFALVDGDLDPQEKVTLEQAAERAREALSAALLADPPPSVAPKSCSRELACLWRQR